MRVQYRVCWTFDIYEEPKYLMMTKCELDHAMTLYNEDDVHGCLDPLHDYLSTMSEWKMDVNICSHVFDGAECFTPIPGLDELK